MALYISPSVEVDFVLNAIYPSGFSGYKVVTGLHDSRCSLM